MKFPANKKQVAVYETMMGTVHVERLPGSYFGLENISNGTSYLPRTRAETEAWLKRHAGRFLQVEDI